MSCCANCPRMERMIRRIIAETPTPTPTPEPRIMPILTGTQMQIDGYPMDSFEDREIVNFAIPITESPNISYSEGNFTILKAGTYFISWQVGTGGTEQLARIAFSITLNGEPYATFSTKLPEPTHEEYISGSAVINAAPGDIVALMNTTDDYCVYKQANITILGVS